MKEERTFCIACGSFCKTPNEKSTNTTFLETKIPIPKELKIFDSNINYNKVITKIINSIGDFGLSIKKLDVLCEQCTVLLQEHQRFYNEMKMIELILKQQMNENYQNIINENSVPDMSDIQLTTGLLLGPEKNHLCDSNGLYQCQDCSEYATLKETTFIAHIKCHQLRGQSFPFEEDKSEILFDNTDEIFNELLTKNFGKSQPKDNRLDDETSHHNLMKMLNKSENGMPEIKAGFYKCDYCVYTFLCRDFLRYHFKKVHKNYDLSEKKKVPCDKCGVFITAKDGICSHSSADEDPIKCQDCQVVYYKQDLLNQHYLNRHRRCFKCKRKFKGNTSLKSHFNACVLEKFKCPGCGLLCATQSGLKSHFSIHTGQLQYQCNLCPKKFAHKIGMQKHKNSIHYKKIQHTCDVCGDLFIDYDRYRKHRVLHDHPFPYPCKYENCPQRFKTPTTRAFHIRIDHLNMFFHCESCGKKFKRVTQLKLHRQTHTKIGLYPCIYCSRRFTSPALLRNHSAKHHPTEIVVASIKNEESK